MRERVKECGKSEGSPVMGEIGVGTSPTRKRADFRVVFPDEKIDETTKKGKQMTEERKVSTGAPFDGVTDWHAINWKSVNDNVRRLQTRLVKATKAGKWGKVKALQRLLTHSFSGKALAVRRVTENQGKNTPGVDQIIWNTPHKKINAVYGLRQRDYHPLPLRRIYIPKKNGKKRALGIPALKDRAMQALYLLALDPVAETTAEPNSYGFRPQRSTADAIEQCFTALGNLQSAQWILEGDIKSCFDGISHAWLLTHIPMEKGILRKWLKSGDMEESVLYPTEEGTPQGGIISPVLANMTLDGLERRLRERFPKTTVKGIAAKVNFIRYADDFIVTAASKELLEQEIKPLIETFMKERGLELSAEKTCITHIRDGFDFLGQNVRKYKRGKQYKLLIKPAHKNVHAHLEKIREIIKKNQTLSAGRLILLLNPIIRGWAQYHQHVVSSDVFRSVDDAIYRRLRQWMRRRHPNKSHKWITRNYFKTHEGHSWVFYGEKDGQEYYLADTADVPIKRHAKVKSEANPYDPEWELHYEKRLDAHMAETLKGKRWLSHLWKEQNGLCPVCQQKITKITGWHSHHREWRSKGGSDTAENRVLLHPNCHQQVHSQGLHVEKPRPVKRAERKA